MGGVGYITSVAKFPPVLPWPPRTPVALPSFKDINMTSKPVWFITGCSTGFGRELARHTLELGYPTVVTARNVSQIEDIAKGHEDNALLLKLDVTKPEDIENAVKAATERSAASTSSSTMPASAISPPSRRARWKRCGRCLRSTSGALPT